MHFLESGWFWAVVIAITTIAGDTAVYIIAFNKGMRYALKHPKKARREVSDFFRGWIRRLAGGPNDD